jgi:hypothetical protein
MIGENFALGHARAELAQDRFHRHARAADHRCSVSSQPVRA